MTVGSSSEALGINPDEVDEIDNPKVIHVIEGCGDSFYE
jgi:hypothetical protein